MDLDWKHGRGIHTLECKFRNAIHKHTKITLPASAGANKDHITEILCVKVWQDSACKVDKAEEVGGKAAEEADGLFIAHI